MKHYVLGFLFSQHPTRVVLIRKNKPDWQRGLLNGVGGKVEDGETAHDAMIREFEEEAGVTVAEWEPFCVMAGGDFRVDVFKATDSHALQQVRSVSDEAVMALFPHAVLDPNPQDCHRPISNVPWLIAMAMDGNYGKPFHATVEYAPTQPGRPQTGE